MTIYRHNRAHGRTFRPSVFCFALCMARLVTFTMRIVWAAEPTNHNVAIVSNVFIAAGVILLVRAVVPLQRRGTAAERGSGRRMMDVCANEVPNSGSSTASSPRGCLASTTHIHIHGPYFDLGYAACPTLSYYAASHSVCEPLLFPLCVSSFQGAASPPHPQTANPDYSNRSHSPKVQDHEPAHPPHRQHHLQDRPCPLCCLHLLAFPRPAGHATNPRPQERERRTCPAGSPRHRPYPQEGGRHRSRHEFVALGAGEFYPARNCYKSRRY